MNFFWMLERIHLVLQTHYCVPCFMQYYCFCCWIFLFGRFSQFYHLVRHLVHKQWLFFWLFVLIFILSWTYEIVFESWRKRRRENEMTVTTTIMTQVLWTRFRRFIFFPESIIYVPLSVQMIHCTLYTVHTYKLHVFSTSITFRSKPTDKM